MNIPDANVPRIVIIGGGFAGLELARSLKNKAVQIVLLDKHNYHTFQPLLYQVATAGLEPDSIGHPLRKIFKGQKNLFFRLTEVSHIDPEKKVVYSSIGELAYDKVVIATGSDTNFFGNSELQHHGMSMKSIPEALDIRSLILQNFEEALLTSDLNEREALMNVIIVGAGPTGVELAGAISELRKHILPRDYPDLDVRRMSIRLIEASPRVLSAMSEKSSADALQALESLDVEVWLDTLVESYDGRVVKTKNGKSFVAKTLIWSAGVKGAPVKGINAEALTRNDRIEVDEFNRVKGIEDAYAVGDVSAMIDEENPRGHAMVAQVAIQQAANLAKNILAESKGKEPTPFKYKDLGSMATIGRNRAVVDLPKGHFRGFFAWVIWMVVHVVQLIGFRNKVLVLVNWTWNYVQYARDARLIIRPFKRSAERGTQNAE
ncbi:NAD(P)/FAD-dependent oxidoreductase [Sanyastnella coralliicola]|uniref:NAD(P)/FAD-dependent oxidoreductase n=1 Tax=Sanyastnella coralliicola TaxID=3069118 RepID=UPI0027BAA560|nr:NAD(P)/FAD-dependent oxidoreductase [Longitalea sp. SCSIO 12813]